MINARQRAHAALVLAALLITLALSGCGGNDMSDLKHYVAQAKAHQSGHIPPLPKIEPYHPFTYRPDKRRDPFQPAQTGPSKPTTPHTGGPRPDPNHVPGPLEQFPLDSLQMLGTLTANGHTYALIASPDGIVHRVSLGEYLGQHYGRVTHITPDTVAVVELVPTGFGGYRKQPASIARGKN